MSSSDMYKFTIENGVVVAVYEYDNSQWELDPIEAYETYTVSGSDIIRTEGYGSLIETKTFSDSDGDEIYEEVSSSSSDDSYDDHSDSDVSEYRDDVEYHGDGYSSDRYIVEVDESTGDVTGFFELEDNGTRENEMEVGATYEIVDGVLYETEYEDYGLQIKTYEDTDGDGFWVKTSSQYTYEGAGGSRYQLSDLLEIEGSDDDDYLLMTQEGGISGGAGADSYVMRELVDCSMLDFDADEGDKIVFDTGYGLSGVDELSDYLSSYAYDESTLTLSLDFSGYASLGIVGIQADQISWSICEVLS